MFFKNCAHEIVGLLIILGIYVSVVKKQNHQHDPQLTQDNKDSDDKLILIGFGIFCLLVLLSMMSIASTCLQNVTMPEPSQNDLQTPFITSEAQKEGVSKPLDKTVPAPKLQLDKTSATQYKIDTPSLDGDTASHKSDDFACVSTASEDFLDLSASHV